MAVETRVLVNGQWVSRSMDIRHILESNHDKDKHKTDHKIPRARSHPILGIISRTLFRSPVINWILPARLRHENKNDVVFVGEDFVYIKEILSDGHLRYIGTKADFGSRIRAAKVFGEPRKIEILETGWPATPDAAAAALLKRQQAAPIKTEEGEVNMNGYSSPTIPPQILILTLESNELVYLFAHQNQNGELRFYDSSLPLPAGRSFLEQPGKFIAVDPKSRAVAVAACEGTLLVWGAKTMDRLRQDYTANSVEWTPFTQEQPFQAIDGAVVKMEFLYPARDDDDHVILLVIFCKNKKMRMTCWDWLHSEGVRSAVVRVNSQPLPRRELPNLIIPLEHSSAFLLIIGNQAYLYNDVLSGTARNTSLAIGGSEAPRYPGSSSRMPLWTSWARTTRHNGWKGDRNEAFYLLREDGAIVYLQVNGGSGVTSGRAGHFDCNADTAFACFEVWRQGLKLSSPDLLVVAGDASNGQVVKIGAWPEDLVPEGSTYKNHDLGRAMVMKPDFLEQFPNWAPLTDMMLFDLSSDKGRSATRREIIITAANRAPHGSITELRHGIEARLAAMVEVEGLEGAVRLWSLPDKNGDGDFLLVSMPFGTTLIHMTKNMQVHVHDAADPGDFCVEFCSETLAVASTREGQVIQVSRRGIHILDLASGQHKLHLSFAPILPDGGTLTAAAIHPATAVVLVAARAEDMTALLRFDITRLVDSFDVAETNASRANADVTFLALFDIGDAVYAFTSLVDRSIHIFRVDRKDVILVFSHNILTASAERSSMVCETAVLLQSVTNASTTNNELLLVCGLRNGQLYTVELNIEFEDDSPQPCFIGGSASAITMGSTSVTLVADHAGPTSAAFLLCGPDLCLINYSKGRAAGLSITSIWVTDRNVPDFEQPQISALSCMYTQNGSESNFAGNLVCVSGPNVLIAQLDEQHQAVPKRTHVDGSPNKLIYCKHLGMMVAASIRTEVVEPRSGSPRHGVSAQRSNRAIINFIRLRKPHGGIEDWQHAGVYELHPAEKIYSLLDWTLKHENGNTYGFLVVGTTISLLPNILSGRVLLLHTRVDEHNNVLVKPSKIMNFKLPVYVIATYGETDLVVSTGKQLQIFRFSPVDKRLSKICIHNIPSPAIHITTHPPLIYVSTSDDSFMAFVLKDNKTDPSPDTPKSLHLLFSDDGARKTTTHLSLSLNLGTPSQPASNSHLEAGSPPTDPQNDASTPSLILVADKSSSVTGLLHPSHKTPALQSAAPTVFEATLPRSVTRLRCGNVRPPWRGNTLPGVLADDVIGSASEGSVFSFSIVDEKAWRLLRFLQNLCRWEREERLERVGRGMSVRAVLDPDREVHGATRKTGFHIDGDVLAAFVEAGGKERLGRLLREMCEGDGTDTANRVGMPERMVRFKELADGLLGSSGADMEEVADEVLGWLKGVLLPAL